MYPVLLFTYGSPSSQIVDYQFNIKKFEAYMTVNYDVIVASMDGRGSSANGERFMKSVYKQLGKLEVDDQFKLAK
jgi:dipeptidyl aminopeptidase/acylaminoacyl peptidase